MTSQKQIEDLKLRANEIREDLVYLKILEARWKSRKRLCHREQTLVWIRNLESDLKDCELAIEKASKDLWIETEEWPECYPSSPTAVLATMENGAVVLASYNRIDNQWHEIIDPVLFEENQITWSQSNVLGFGPIIRFWKSC